MANLCTNSCSTRGRNKTSSSCPYHNEVVYNCAFWVWPHRRMDIVQQADIRFIMRQHIEFLHGEQEVFIEGLQRRLKHVVILVRGDQLWEVLAPRKVLLVYFVLFFVYKKRR